MGKLGTKLVDKITECIITIDEIIMVLVNVFGHVPHQASVNLFELGQRLFAILDDAFVGPLPAFEVSDLALERFRCSIRGRGPLRCPAQ